MARIDWVKNKLENWALWAARERGGGLGFATQSVILRGDLVDESRQARIPVDEVEASVTDQAVSSLAAAHRAQQDTLVAYYIDGRSAVGIAQIFSISESTVHSRLASADRLLAAWFSARSERHAAAAIAARPVVPTGVGAFHRSPKRSFTT